MSLLIDSLNYWNALSLRTVFHFCFALNNLHACFEDIESLNISWNSLSREITATFECLIEFSIWSFQLSHSADWVVLLISSPYQLKKNSYLNRPLFKTLPSSTKNLKRQHLHSQHTLSRLTSFPHNISHKNLSSGFGLCMNSMWLIHNESVSHSYNAIEFAPLTRTRQYKQSYRGCVRQTTTNSCVYMRNNAHDRIIVNCVYMPKGCTVHT